MRARSATGFSPCQVGKEINVAEFSGEGIDRPGASNPDAGKFGAGCGQHGAQQMLDALQRLGITPLRIGWALRLRQYAAVVVDHPNRNLCPANIYCSNHSISFPSESLLPLHDRRLVGLQINLPVGAFERQRFRTFRSNLADRFHRHRRRNRHLVSLCTVIHDHRIAAMVSTQRSHFDRGLVTLEGRMNAGPVSERLVDAMGALRFLKCRRQCWRDRFRADRPTAAFSLRQSCS